MTYCVMAVNSVGNQLQYLIQAPAPEASGGGSESDEGQAEPMPNKEIMDQAEQLDSVMEGLSGNVSAYTLTGIVDQQSFQSDIGNGAQGRLELLGENAFAVRPKYLRYGRLFFPEELKNGTDVILLDEQLALQLFNIGDPLERTVTVSGKDYRVIGIVRHQKQVGDLNDAGAYIPLASVTSMELTVDALMVTATPIAGTGASVAFKSAMDGWKSGGTMIDLGKESMGAKLWIRLLLFLCGMTLTLRAVRFLNRRVHDVLRDNGERLKSSYAIRLMPRFTGQALVLGLGYLLCAGAAAVLMQYLIEPVYTFPEWIPAVLVEWEEIANAFWKCWQTPATLSTGRPGPLMDMDYVPLDQDAVLGKVKMVNKEGVTLARILNARQVLEALPNTTAYGSFVLEVTDDQIPQNNGKYLISCQPEGKTVTETERNYDMQMNMRALTRLVYGKRSLRDFLEDGEGFDLTQRCPTMDGLFSHHLQLMNQVDA